MIFQTRSVSRKEFQVGEYLQEKNETGRKNYMRERQNAQERLDKKRETEFDFDDYIHQMEEEYNRDTRMEI